LHVLIAASAAAVTLGKASQNPSPSGFTMCPSCAAARRVSKARCSLRRAARSASAIAWNRGVDPAMSVFRIAVVRSVVVVTPRAAW
jgi:hypothetical protein